MANADKCHLIIPFKSYLMTLADAVDDEGKIDKAAFMLAGQREFENYKAIERRINDPACNGATGGNGPISSVILDESDGTDVLGSVGYTSSAFDMQPGDLFLVAFIYHRNAGAAPAGVVTHSGGATFTMVRGVNWASGDGARLEVWRCQPSTFYGGGTLSLTSSSAGITMIRGLWHVIGFTGAFDDRTNNGAGAILESADRGLNTSTTSSTVTLTTRVNSPDSIYAAFGIGASNTTATVGATYNQLALSTVENVVLFSEYKYGDNTSDATASWTNTTLNQAIALSIKSS